MIDYIPDIISCYQELSSQSFAIENSANIKTYGLENINSDADEHFLVYEMLNTRSNKYYIGQHITDNPDDGYAGSGTYLRRAEQRHGLSNFVKIILKDCVSYDEMNNLEKQLVPLSGCYPYNPNSYNLKEGEAMEG